MAKDVNIHIKTRGAQQTRQQLDSVGKSAKDVGDKTAEAGGKGASGIDKLSTSAESSAKKFGKFASQIVAWAASLATIGAVIRIITSAVRIQMQAIKEHADIIERQQKQLLSLQYLGQMFKERPELRKEVAAYAEFGRRPFEEVAQAWYNLRSKAARLPTEQRQDILTQALELGRMYPEAPLDTLVDMFSLYAKQTRARDINQVQNVLLQTITEAGGGMADVAKYMPQFLPIGLQGGLTGPEAAGIWAYVTTQFAEPSMATMGLKNVLLALQGKGTPESQEMLQQLGIKPGMPFLEQLQVISAQQKRGKFRLPEAEMLAGKESAAVLLSLLSDQRAMFETINNVVQAAQTRRDITAEMIEDLMSSDELARLEEESRQLGIEITNIKGRDVRALQWSNYIKEYEKQLRKAGHPEHFIREKLFYLQLGTGFGVAPWSDIQRTMVPTPGHPETELPRGPSFRGTGFTGTWQKEHEGTAEPAALPAEPTALPAEPAAQKEIGPVSAATIINQHFDQSTHYYPRVGYEPEPRVGRYIT